MTKKHNGINSENSVSPFPYRRNKYYLRRNWIFTCLAVMAVLIFGGAKIYYQNAPDAGMVEAKIVRVVDGDTVVVAVDGAEEKIRLIGVDSPESVNENEKENSIYGEYASAYSKKHLSEGQIIYLTFDMERMDQYNRLLAYVWLEPETGNIDNLYQKQLVADGYAFAIYYEPNTKYATELSAAMETAIEGKRGLWAYDDFYDDNKNKALYYQSF